MIRYQVNLHLRIHNRNSLQRFFVMDLGNKNTIILGHPWLTKVNLIIDWTAGTVKLRGTSIPRHDDPKILEQRYLLRYLHAMEKDNSELAAWIYTQQKNAATLRRVLEEDHPHIRKLTLSMALAQAAEKVEYLRLVVRNGEVLMDPTKLRVVEQWEPPKSVKVVRSFIGFCNFYQKFIPHFSALA